jgi:hypothetical protein
MATKVKPGGSGSIKMVIIGVAVDQGVRLARKYGPQLADKFAETVIDKGPVVVKMVVGGVQEQGPPAIRKLRGGVDSAGRQVQERTRAWRSRRRQPEEMEAGPRGQTEKGNRTGRDVCMSTPLSAAELEHLHSRLSPEKRDELLQCLLIAAPRGGEAMARVLEDLLLCQATEELLAEHDGDESGLIEPDSGMGG